MNQKVKIILTTILLSNFFYIQTIYAENERKISSKIDLKKKSQKQHSTSPEELSTKGNIQVVMNTSLGKIKLELFKEKDPLTVNNFLSYVKAGFYNGTIFHRIIDGFIIQGGAYDKNFNEKINKQPSIKNMSHLGLKNTIGTIAMARKPNAPDSATSQFFINLLNNQNLDYQRNEHGYAVFGKITSGLEIVQKIAKQKIGQREGMYYVPFYPEFAIIHSIECSECSLNNTN
ncbi:MAG: peptidyl-prolyl cis-trans isomerase [Spirobacillus cienkowskii]|jgi:peptidyl-prolyl cis-trans isomerase A (cyclophilin A)|uniref:Peptidyl-prolyl cis-trans isomerase n=1 Tax=Spirobacillus cienkowskii TaxID=495820 RepID=A0A369KWT4_9BACT|nr:MAG: peptidyl-prolyl cis-trans isomerase [Spirobacillus cienkowskii]